MRFLLVDRIDGPTADGGFAGCKVVALSEDVLEHHFPGRPILPGVLLLEALGQLAGWSVADESDFQSWFLIDTVHRCAFYGFVLPGDRVDLVVEPLPAENGRRRFKGRGTVDGERRVEAEIEGPVVDLADLEDPAASRRLMAHLQREFLVSETVVITGVGIESALGRGPDVTWSGLLSGRSGITETGSTEDPGWRRWAGRTEQPAVPEPVLDRLRGEGRFLNRGGLLGLQVAVDAMAAAGPATEIPPQRRSLYLATGDLTTADCARLRPATAAATEDFTASLDTEILNRTTVASVYPFYLLETLCNNPFSALATAFELMGPGTTLSSHAPCGVQALELAWRSLERGRTDQALVVACGSWVAALPQIELHGLDRLTETGGGATAFRPLDAHRDGFIPGEGAVALVLETESGARRRQASTFATISAVAQTSGVGTAPFAVDAALSKAGLAIEDVGCIVAHGDASGDGDREELETFARVLADSRRRPAITAVKPATGHLGAPSDLLEIVAAAFAVRSGRVPPTLNFRSAEPGFDGLSIAASEQKCMTPFALTLSRGFGSQRTAVVVSAP